MTEQDDSPSQFQEIEPNNTTNTTNTINTTGEGNIFQRCLLLSDYVK